MTNYFATRRSLLTGAGAVFAWAYLPEFARAAGERDPRLVVIILRGALDGLSAVAPVGDPDYLALHGSLALSLGGDHPALPLDSFFALNPAMPVLKRLYDQRQAAIIHAVASPYRDRSHFDGQDVLESGYPAPERLAQPRPRRAAERRPRGGIERPWHRTGDAARFARIRAGARLGAAELAACLRRSRGPAPRSLRASRSSLGRGTLSRP
jgi:uncharacterized protein (DUF1501 family)